MKRSLVAVSLLFIFITAACGTGQVDTEQEAARKAYDDESIPYLRAVVVLQTAGDEGRVSPAEWVRWKAFIADAQRANSVVYQHLVLWQATGVKSFEYDGDLKKLRDAQAVIISISKGVTP